MTILLLTDKMDLCLSFSFKITVDEKFKRRKKDAEGKIGNVC